jgi:hypothetical protein
MVLLRIVFRALLLLIFIGLIWHYRLALQELLTSTAAKAKPIVFDNGTVRQYAPALGPAQSASQTTGQAPIPHGTLRRCTKGTEVSYANSACPPGHQEKALSTDKFNVVPGK